MSNDDLKKTFVDQRHEFIMHYYDMAVQDLSTHFNIGWQTIATVAGSVVVLGLGEQGFLPIPIAITVVLVLSTWGLLNIIDSDFWTKRAIAFLANVEALYFYSSDKEVFNPYIGKHPPAKMQSSLKAQRFAVMFVMILTFLYYGQSVFSRTDQLRKFSDWYISTEPYNILMWMFPIICLIISGWVILNAIKKRTNDYFDFVTTSPGPGLVKGPDHIRGILSLHQSISVDVEKGLDLQADLIKDLKKIIMINEKRIKYYKIFNWFIGIVLSIAFVFKTVTFYWQ
jgi:hypothetical protein